MIISLDLSTKPGFAILRSDGTVMASGTSRPSRLIAGEYPQSYVSHAETVIESLIHKLVTHLHFNQKNSMDVTTIAVEETTSSSQNYSQKILEFIHYDFLKQAPVIFPNAKVVYLRDGIWKSLTGARMTDAEKKNNAKIGRLKKKKAEANPQLKRIIVKKDKEGNPVRRVTEQDAYIRRANEVYGLDLGRENEDEAAALLIAKAFLMGAPICDGTITGGLFTKDKDKESLNG